MGWFSDDYEGRTESKPEQGFFESDKDYKERIYRESKERTIEDATGSKPSQGFFESDESYRSRVAREANERIVEKAAGNSPSQGFFESDESYHRRIAQEANERIVEGATGSKPSQGFFESDESYRSRVAQEARERIIEKATGNSPSQGFFESDESYRARINREAREVMASRRVSLSTSSSAPGYGSGGSAGGGGSSSSSDSSSGAGVVLKIFIIIMLGYGVMLLSDKGKNTISTSSTSTTQKTFQDQETLYVNTQQMKLRSGPGVQHSDIGRVFYGDAVTVSESAISTDGGKWVRVKSGNLDGWLNKKFLTVTQQNPVVDNLSEADKRLAVANRIDKNQNLESVKRIISTETFKLSGKIQGVSEPEGSGGFWYFKVLSTDDKEEYSFGCSSQSELYFRIQARDVNWSDGMKAMNVKGVNVVLHFREKDRDFFQRCSRGSKCDGRICPIGIEIN